MQLREIMTTYGEACIRFAYLYTKDWNAAEEVVQDVFLAYANQHEAFRGDSSLKTYLLKITANKSKDYLRKKKRWGWLSFEEPPEKVTASSERLLEREEEQQELLQALHQIPLKYREVLILYYYEEMNTTDIAALLQCSKNTIKTRLIRGRNQLKAQLKDNDWEVLMNEEF